MECPIEAWLLASLDIVVQGQVFLRCFHILLQDGLLDPWRLLAVYRFGFRVYGLYKVSTSYGLLEPVLSDMSSSFVAVAADACSLSKSS